MSGEEGTSEAAQRSGLVALKGHASQRFVTFQRKVGAICLNEGAYDKEELNTLKTFLAQYEEQKDKCLELSMVLEERYRTVGNEPETKQMEDYFTEVSGREEKPEDLLQEATKAINNKKFNRTQ